MTAENNEGLPYDQHEPDQRDCLRQRHGASAGYQELNREDRPKKRHHSAGSEIEGKPDRNRERDPQPNVELARPQCVPGPNSIRRHRSIQMKWG